MANALYKDKPTVTVTPAVPPVSEQVETHVDIPAVVPHLLYAGPVYEYVQNPVATNLFYYFYTHNSAGGVSFDYIPFDESLMYHASGPNIDQSANFTVRYIYDTPSAPSVPASPSGPGGLTYRLHYLPVPAQAGVAEQTLVDRHEGWDISANSIVSIEGRKAYKATFKIPDGVIGAYCGTRARTTDMESGSQIWDWAAFRKDKTVLSISDMGNNIVGGTDARNIAHNSDSILGILFDGVQTLYTVDGVLVASSSSRTALPIELVASLYAPGDYVYDPTLIAFSGGVGGCTFLPMNVKGGVSTADGRATFPPMTVSVTAALNNLSFLPMSVKGGAHTVDGLATFKTMTVRAHMALAPPVFTSAVCSFSPLRVSASTTGHMIGSASFRPMKVKGGIPTSDGSYSFEALQVYSAGYTDSRTEVAVNEWITCADMEVPVAIKPAIVSESLGLAIVFAPIPVRVANAQSLMTFTGTHALLSTMQGLAITVLDFGTPTPPYTDPDYVWVVNDDTGATSTYANFKFNSYAKLGERYYGMQSDGLYLLEGDDDAGTTTLANIGFGQQDFGTTAAKRVINVYVGVASTGALLLKISTNSVEAVYVQQRVSEDQRVARFVPGKGMQGTLLAFELYNEDNADFTLSSVEFHAIPLTRRI